MSQNENPNALLRALAREPARGAPDAPTGQTMDRLFKAALGDIKRAEDMQRRRYGSNGCEHAVQTWC